METKFTVMNFWVHFIFGISEAFLKTSDLSNSPENIVRMYLPSAPVF